MIKLLITFFIVGVYASTGASCPSCNCNSNTYGQTADRYSTCLLYKPSELQINGTSALQCTYLDKFCRCVNYMTKYNFLDLSSECTMSCRSYGCSYNCDIFYKGSWSAWSGDDTNDSNLLESGALPTVMLLCFVINYFIDLF